MATSGRPMPSVPAVTETGIPFEAATASPSIDTKRQEKTSPAKRLASRKGSSAENSAIMENRGMSRKAISRAIAVKINQMSEKVKSIEYLSLFYCRRHFLGGHNEPESHHHLRRDRCR